MARGRIFDRRDDASNENFPRDMTPFFNKICAKALHETLARMRGMVPARLWFEVVMQVPDRATLKAVGGVCLNIAGFPNAACFSRQGGFRILNMYFMESSVDYLNGRAPGVCSIF